MREPLGHRFFFALLPPIQLARIVANAAHWFEGTGRPLRPDRLHVTMFILPDFARYMEAVVKLLLGVGNGLAAAPVEMMLDRVVGSRSSVALKPSHRIDLLASLRRELVDGARTAGIPERPDYRFAPHVTLGYREGAPFQERVKPISWRANEVVLIHSLLGQTRHEVLGRWPLNGGGGEQPLLL